MEFNASRIDPKVDEIALGGDMAAIAVVAFVAKAEEDWEVVNQVLKLSVQRNYMAVFHSFRIIEEAR